MNDEVDKQDIANFIFISSTSIPPTNANLNQQFTHTLSNIGGNLTPLSAYAYLNDSSGNSAYVQANSLQQQPNPFPQQPSMMFENFSNPFDSGQPPNYQYNPPIMMGQQVNPNGLIYQGAAGTQDTAMPNPFHNEHYLFIPNPQPQEIFSSTLNNGIFCPQQPTSFFNNINPNFTGVPNNFSRAESMINQIPQLQRFSCVNGNDISFFSPIPKPIPLQVNWSFAPRPLNGEKEIVNQVVPSNEEGLQNYILRIEQVTLITAVPIDSNDVTSGQIPSNQTFTNIQHRYITDSEGLTILSQIGDNKPQVIKIDTESIKQMLRANSSFYIQQFMNGPKGKVKKESTTEMQTDGSLRTNIAKTENRNKESTEVIQILEPKELLPEEGHEDLQRLSSRDDLEYDGRDIPEVKDEPVSENVSEPEPSSSDENNEPILDK